MDDFDLWLLATAQPDLVTPPPSILINTPAGWRELRKGD